MKFFRGGLHDYKRKSSDFSWYIQCEVLGVETLHDNKSDEYIADYIRLKIRDDFKEQNVNVYLGNDYKIVENKDFYIESKIKNALHSAL